MHESVTHTTAEIAALIGDRTAEELKAANEQVTFAGLLMFSKKGKKEGRGRVQDLAGQIGLYIRRDGSKDSSCDPSAPRNEGFQVVAKDAYAPIWALEIGRHVTVTGVLMRAADGEAVVNVQKLTASSASVMHPFDPQRLQKVDALRESGVEPYTHGLHITHTAAEVLALIGERTAEELKAAGEQVTIAGRLRFQNKMGKAGFGRIQDRSGRIQFYIRRDSSEDDSCDPAHEKNDGFQVVGRDAFSKVWKKLDLGDHVHVTGVLMRTSTGEPTVNVREITLSSKCITSLPDKHHGLTDQEQRSRQRYLDLFVNEEARETFRRRSQIVRYIRTFFEERAFMEVETPMLQTIPGGATARPFTTHHNALDMELFMRIAPELYLKRLVVGGFERVYEVNRNFRNEGISTKHNPEFTMLEFYWAYATWHDLMDLTEQLVRELAENVCGSTSVTYGEHTLDFGSPWRRLPMAQGISEATGLTAEQVRDVGALRAYWLEQHPSADTDELPTTMGKWFELYFDRYVEPGLIQPTFITHFPTEISPLSRRNDEDPEIVDRFELFIAGREIANGFNELNDPVDQAVRFAAQVAEREGGDDEAMYFDADYINALTYGLPPTAGEGIGIDRLVMLLTNQHSIRDVILFPTLRRAR